MGGISARYQMNITTAPVSSSKFDFNVRLAIALGCWGISPLVRPKGLSDPHQRDVCISHAKSKEEWSTSAREFAGAFGPFIAVGIRIGLDALDKLEAGPRGLTVTTPGPSRLVRVWPMAS
jgi:hypothetical protein